RIRPPFERLGWTGHAARQWPEGRALRDDGHYRRPARDRRRAGPAALDRRARLCRLGRGAARRGNDPSWVVRRAGDARDSVRHSHGRTVGGGVQGGGHRPALARKRDRRGLGFGQRSQRLFQWPQPLLVRFPRADAGSIERAVDLLHAWGPDDPFGLVESQQRGIPSKAEMIERLPENWLRFDDQLFITNVVDEFGRDSA